MGTPTRNVRTKRTDPRVVVASDGELLGTVEAPAADAPFAWNSVPADHRPWLKDATARVVALHKRTAEDTLAMGRLVAEAKARLGHGLFLAWVAAELPFTPRTAQRMVNVAGVFEDAKCDTVSHFEPGALYELAAPSAPPEARSAALAAAERGLTVTREKARAIVAATKPASDRPPQPAGQEKIIDRLDGLISSGRLRLTGSPSERAATEVTLTYGEYKRLCQALFPESFPADRDEDEPVAAITHAPGSAAKIKALMDRAAKKLPLHQPGDQLPDDDHVPDIEPRAGGAGRYCPECQRRMPPAPVVKGWKAK